MTDCEKCIEKTMAKINDRTPLKALKAITETKKYVSNRTL